MTSKTQIRKAGKRLRKWWVDDSLEFTEDEWVDIDWALVVADQYRIGFERPMHSIRMSTGSFVKTCGYPEAKVAQRHKRMARIISKLARFPTMQLTNMEDIGGVRAVLPTLEAVRTVERHVEKAWKGHIHRHRDYISEPQETGYQAIHFVVERHERLIEVQVRTNRQNIWAQLNESLSRQAGAELKWGDGPEDIKEFLRELGEGLAVLDRGEVLSAAQRNVIAEAAHRVE